MQIRFVKLGLVATLVSYVLAIANLVHAYPTGYSTEAVRINAQESCTVVRPWTSLDPPKRSKYPIIIWVNGWDYRSDNDTGGYLPGLIEWALDGPYVIVADNSRNPFEADALACADWIVQQSKMKGSAYQGIVDPETMGLAGHSQGAGVVLTARKLKARYKIKGVVAMNPWNWGKLDVRWLDAREQDGPVFILGGSLDTIAPVHAYARPAWQAVREGGGGGIFTVLNGATHNSEAWAPGAVYPDSCDFGRWQSPTTLWWRNKLYGDAAAGAALMAILDNRTPVKLVSNCGDYPPLQTPNWSTLDASGGGSPNP